MSKRIIMRVRGEPIWWDAEKGEITFLAGMSIDGDGQFGRNALA